MRPRRAAMVAACVLAAGLLGCGTDFSPVSQVTTLRVLAVQKDKPYAKPGDTVELSMLWHDGSDEAPRPIQRAWVAFCFNPPGDLFTGCFADPARAGDVHAEMGDSVANDRFAFPIPRDIISGSRPGSESLRYGLSYVLFAICAGDLSLRSPSAEAPFPLSCKDEGGRDLGPEDFVAGYSAIYSYEEITNQNPRITGLEFDGRDVTADCLGVSCVTTPVTEPDCNEGGTCIPSCAEDGEPECPGYEFRAIVDPKSVELDEASETQSQGPYLEQMWVNYHVSSGAVDSDVKLVNDAVQGFHPEHETVVRAPKKSGPLTLWAIVRDNRGGVDWARFTVGVD